MGRLQATIVVLCVIPLTLWFVIDPSLARFSSTPLIFNSLGQITALLGFTLFAFNIVLAARFPWVEKVFGPLNKMYVTHHLIGVSVWILLLIHPLGLVSTYGLGLLLPTYGNWARNLGLSAVLLLSALLILTLFVKLPYEIWKATHKYLPVVFVIGAVHGLFVPSDVSASVALTVYVSIVSFIAVVGGVYRSSPLSRFLVKKYKYKVSTVTQTGSVTEITLVPEKEHMVFIPGQFAFFKFQIPGFTETHPFSIVYSNSSPLGMCIKSEGDYTSKIHSVPVGTPVLIEGPFGRFSYYFHNRARQIWIAGGIGITPFLSLAQSLPANGVYTTDLYYVVKNKEEAFKLEYLKQLETQKKGLTVIPIFTNSEGHLTAEQVVEKSKNISRADIFVCGPPPMMKSLRAQFNRLGIRHGHIHTEEFSLN